MISSEKVNISLLPFHSSNINTFMSEIIEKNCEVEKKTFIVTANPEIVMETRKNISYRHAVEEADYIVPDGMGILLAAKLKGTPLESRIAGFDLMTEMLVYANEVGASCYFLGAKESVNNKAVQNIKETYPNIVIAGQYHGYFDIYDESVKVDVVQSGADFVFAALGFPKQEEWIASTNKKAHKGIFMGVGGSFDVFAGNAKRAPNIWIKFKLEWLYRLLKQPSRWRRMIPLIHFSILALLRKL